MNSIIKFQISKYPDVQVHIHSNSRTMIFPNIRFSIYSNIQFPIRCSILLRFPDIRVLNFSNIQLSFPKYPHSQTLRRPNIQTSRFLNIQIFKHTTGRFPKRPTSELFRARVKRSPPNQLNPTSSQFSFLRERVEKFCPPGETKNI